MSNVKIEESIYYKMVQVGAKFTTKEGSEIRIMAIAEGYAMLRKKGCMPFIESVKNLAKWLESQMTKKDLTNP